MRIALILLVVLLGCDKLQKKRGGEPIARASSDHMVSLQVPPHRVRDPYSWEERFIGAHPRITKEFFRCRGSSRNPVDTVRNGRGDLMCLIDCGGIDQHTLPVTEEKEQVYPVLIQLLNHLQESLNKRVIITCGHRCPAHNNYADRSGKERSSKHLIAAEVDFYVQGMEEHPWTVVKHLMEYYENDASEYARFSRRERGRYSCSTPPWANKEVLIKLYGKGEGRDYDNSHPYPYISIEVLYDREKRAPVRYSWQRAFNGYMRW